MNTYYRRTKTTVFLVNYRFVFCPRYRRKIFRDNEIENRFKEIVVEVCSELDISVLAMECHIDHVHLFLNAPPKLSPSRIMAKIKGTSSRLLREEFDTLGSAVSLWTRSFFVSTAGNVSSETIKKYVDEQKTRG